MSHLRLQASPDNLDHLGQSINLLETLQKDLPKIEARIPPLHEQFAILEKYEVDIPENVTAISIFFFFFCIVNEKLFAYRAVASSFLWKSPHLVTHTPAITGIW